MLAAAEQSTARKGEKTQTCQAGLMREVREKGESTTKLLSFVRCLNLYLWVSVQSFAVFPRAVTTFFSQLPRLLTSRSLWLSQEGMILKCVRESS